MHPPQNTQNISRPQISFSGIASATSMLAGIGLTALSWWLNYFWGGHWAMTVAVGTLMTGLYFFSSQTSLSLIRRHFFGLLLIGSLTSAYYLLFASEFISGNHLFQGSTYQHWSALFLSLYSIKHFDAFPWWDPTSFNGHPLYYQLLSGWSNYLSPFHLPSLLLFKLSCLIGDPSINKYIAFHRTVYFFTINLTLFYLISREIVKHRMAIVFSALVYTLCYTQVTNFRDFFIFESLPAQLFYLYALVRHNNQRTVRSMVVLILGIGLFLASLDRSLMVTGISWTMLFTLALVAFNHKIIPISWMLIKQLAFSTKGKLVIIIGICMLLSSVFASLSPVFFNFGKSGMDHDFSFVTRLTNGHSHMGLSDKWTILKTWMPSFKLSTQFWSASMKTYHWATWDTYQYGYIGLATVPLIISALVLGLRNRYVFICIFTFVVGATLYFAGNQSILFIHKHPEFVHSHPVRLLKFLADITFISGNHPNMAALFPNGGYFFLLILTAVIGLDTLLQNGRTTEKSKISSTLFPVLLIGLIILGMLSFFTIFLFLPSALAREFLVYLGVYLISFSLLVFGLFLSKEDSVKNHLAVALLILVFLDLTTSASLHFLKAPLLPNDRLHTDVFRVIAKDHKELNISDDTRFMPLGTGESSMFPATYKGTFHNPQQVEIGKREWLTIQTYPAWRPLLEGWDSEKMRTNEYPVFHVFSHARYLAYDAIPKPSRRSRFGAGKLADTPYDKTFDEMAKNTLAVYPYFFLHDPNLTKPASSPPQEIYAERSLLEYTPNRVVMKINSKENGFLYYADNHDRFWSARVNGQNTPIHRANFTFKSIALPKGEHMVEWIYDPYPIKFAYSFFYILLAGYGVMALLKLRAPYNEDEIAKGEQVISQTPKSNISNGLWKTLKYSPIVALMTLAAFWLNSDKLKDAYAIWDMNSQDQNKIQDNKGKNHATPINIEIINGHSGNAAYLNGNDAYIQTPINFHGWKGITISFWIKPENKLGGELAIILDNGHDSDSNFAIQSADTIGEKWVWHCNGKDILFDLPLNQWSHVIAWADSESGMIGASVNGRISGEVKTASKIEFGSTSLVIGKLAKTNERYFKGGIDQFALWNKVNESVIP